MIQRQTSADIQRHWLPNEEKVQFSPADHPGTALSPVNSSTQTSGAGPDFGVSIGERNARFEREELAGLNLWANPAAHGLVQRKNGKDAPPVKVPPAPAGGKLDPGGNEGAVKGAVAKLPPISFDKREFPADGKTTNQATIKNLPAGADLKWSINDPDFGSRIGPTGLITPGSDLAGKEKVYVVVKATDLKSGAFKEGKILLWDAKLLQAKKDFPKFVAQTHSKLDFLIGLNGKFDVVYQPAAKLANVNVKVKFDFPDDPIPEPSIFNLFGLTIRKDVAEAKARHRDHANKFLDTIKSQWSNRYRFQNVREPKSIWGKLNPVDVKVNVLEVKSNPHFTVHIFQKKKGTASVLRPDVKLFQGNLVPAPAFNPGTAAGELKRVRRNTPSPILFENNKSSVPADDLNKLQFLNTYLSRINNPKFKLEITGYASKTGNSADNQTLSELRAANVEGALSGASQHDITSSGKGDTVSGPGGEWRKVEVASSIPAGWQNMQDVTAHEFGHMIGLGDEYAATGAGPTATHYDLVKKAFGTDYADQVAKRGDTDYASIMEGGNDVRIQHYVTIWAGLVEATKSAALPDPKFGFDDWKFLE
jgi:outer membrane protein OmpA-like peptidoglycan-associated protein